MTLQVVNCLPGQIEFDQAIKAIAQASLALQKGEVGHSQMSLTYLTSLPPFSLQFPSANGVSYQTLQSNLSACAASLNVSGSEVMSAAKSTPEHQAEAAAKFSKTFNEMLAAGLTLAGASKVGLMMVATV